jgi:hypothetical protein
MIASVPRRSGIRASAIVVCVILFLLPAVVRSAGPAPGAAQPAANRRPPADTRPAPQTQPASYVHQDSGYAYPAAMGDWKFDSTHDYRNDGTDVSGGYYRRPRKAFLTMYVYPAPPGAAGPTFQLDEKGRRIAEPNSDLKFRIAPAGYTYTSHYQQCIGPIFTQLKAEIDSVRLVQAVPERNGPLGLLTRFRGEYEGDPVRTELLIFVSRGHFVKFRITGPPEEAAGGFWHGEYPEFPFKDDQKDTADLLGRLAESNDLQGMHAFGEAMLRGGGVPRDPLKGFDWCKKAGDHGCAAAYRTLGEALLSGARGKPDNPDAIEYFRKAAEGGDAPGMHAMGLALAKGTGVKKDANQAAEWFAAAAKKGWLPSITSLGWAYARGEGVEKDEEHARLLFARAAKYGDPEAAEALKQLK